MPNFESKWLPCIYLDAPTFRDPLRAGCTSPIVPLGSHLAVVENAVTESRLIRKPRERSARGPYRKASGTRERAGSPLCRGDYRLEPGECQSALDDKVEIQTAPGREWMALCAAFMRLCVYEGGLFSATGCRSPGPSPCGGAARLCKAEPVLPSVGFNRRYSIGKPLPHLGFCLTPLRGVEGWASCKGALNRSA
jgi:hypothetical protein